MKANKFIVLKLIVLCLSFNAVFGQIDSPKVFTYDEFMERVISFHPITFQANFKAREGDAYILKSRGGFDPKLQGDIQQKYFESKEYYSHIGAGLKVPTWFGISAQVGFDQGRGEYLSGERLTPASGLWYAGVEVNLGKGLIIDERRAELRQAHIYAQSAEMERQLILNELIYDASVAYWEWFKAFNYYQIFETALQTSRIRFENVIQLAATGDRPYIDTVEAVIQYQNQMVNFEQALLEWKNKTQKLEIYLWQDGFIPLELEENVNPPDLNSINPVLIPLSFQSRIDSAVVNHPKLLISQYKIDYLRVENQLNKEALKPTASLKYNALSTFQQKDLSDNYSVNNYNWGATIAYPIFTRKERGMIRLTDLRIQSSEANLSVETQKLRNSIQMALNMNQTTLNQLEILKQNVRSNELLFDAEQRLYMIGESSLFMVNTRELSLISAKQKLIEMTTNNLVSKHFVEYQLADPSSLKND